MGDARGLDDIQWWRKPFSMLQTNLREIDADMGVDHVADYIKNHGASAWLIGIGGIQAQYPTELAFHSKNAHVAARESGDLIGDALKAASARGLRLLARMDFSKVSRAIATAHPDWLYESPKGNEQSHSRDVVSVCPSTEWYQERTFDILGEILDRYEVDGFFINWASYNERDYFRVYHGKF